MSPTSTDKKLNGFASEAEFDAWVDEDAKRAAQSINDVVTGKIPEDSKTLPPTLNVVTGETQAGETPV